jgi:hypothetical protein
MFAFACCLQASPPVAPTPASPSAAPAPAAAARPERDPTTQELDDSCRAFDAAPAATRDAIVAEITKRIEATREPGLRQLLTWRDRAVRELVVVPAPAPEFYDPNVYARGLVHRIVAAGGDADSAEKRELYRPWENQSFYFGTVRYDFGRNRGLDGGGALTAEESLRNFLYGYPPGADRLVAWVAARFDFDASIDPLALHFDHVYCDLNGKAYPEITLYDAWSSGNSLDMPDVDVIAFARTLLKDDSWVSPIPSHVAQPLYDKVREGFLKLFKYRVWIESAANVFVNPEAPIRGTHEGLRSRLLYMYGLDGGDLEKAAARIGGFDSRGEFLSKIDTLIQDDPGADRKVAEFTSKRASARWEVARAAYAVLRENHLLAGAGPAK